MLRVNLSSHYESSFVMGAMLFVPVDAEVTTSTTETSIYLPYMGQDIDVVADIPEGKFAYLLRRKGWPQDDAYEWCAYKCDNSGVVSRVLEFSSDEFEYIDSDGDRCRKEEYWTKVNEWCILRDILRDDARYKEVN